MGIALAEPTIIRSYSEHLVVRDADTLLINGTGIFLTTGDSWDFYQGYTLNIKSVNLDKKQVWVKLLNNDELLEEGILSEGEILVYSKEEQEILNITVDTIYISPEGELITFKPVYQHQDPDLPDPRIEEVEDNSSQNNDNVSIVEDNSKQSSGFTILQALAGISLILLSRSTFTK
ncbi:S-layer protein [Methanolobus profundi]|uniref:S-layer protein n=2 Tax=Methanolobus profundi TaxID=487685 RepID=A0A1I4SA79_9EURY|nr:S-layer protein [Methanolobus profundi]